MVYPSLDDLFAQQLSASVSVSGAWIHLASGSVSDKLGVSPPLGPVTRAAPVPPAGSGHQLAAREKSSIPTKFL